MLSQSAEKEDLIVVARDGDFASDLDSNIFNHFMHREWKEKKHSDIEFYRDLKPLFERYYPDINISEYSIILPNKQLLCSSLLMSGSFEGTHSNIQKLSKYNSFDEKELSSLVSALRLNEQVYWIIGDYDVKEFYQRLFHEFGHKLTSEDFDFLEEMVGPGLLEEEEDEIPF